jgi:hypothetical protein
MQDLHLRGHQVGGKGSYKSLTSLRDTSGKRLSELPELRKPGGWRGEIEEKILDLPLFFKNVPQLEGNSLQYLTPGTPRPLLNSCHIPDKS